MSKAADESSRAETLGSEPSGQKMPYTLTAAYGEARFDELYEKALLRKRLFKEYILRHQVLERLNQAIEALYDCDALPEDPMEYITAYVKAPPPAGKRPLSGGPRAGPVLTLGGGSAAAPAGHISTGGHR